MVATTAITKTLRYVMREPPPERRRTCRQKYAILDDNGTHDFYVDYGEYADKRLCEIFIVSKKTGSFVRGVLDSLARSVSLALQCGTTPLELARQLQGQNYPPQGVVEAIGSTVTKCSSIVDCIGQEIEACYGEDGKRK